MRPPSNRHQKQVPRTLVAVLALSAVGLTALADKTADVREPVKPRRVLFNCDGHGVRVYDNKGHDLNKWIANLFTGLEGGHVDLLLWCDGAGGNTAL